MPLFLAGHVLGLGGYDHLVLNVLKGLTESGINVCRDARACFRKQLVPPAIRPSELRRKRDHPRLAIAPPHLLGRYKPDERTAAFTMWETDTLPPDGVQQLNRCGLVIVPSALGGTFVSRQRRLGADLDCAARLRPEGVRSANSRVWIPPQWKRSSPSARPGAR